MKRILFISLLLALPLSGQDNPRDHFRQNYVKDGFDGRPAKNNQDYNQVAQPSIDTNQNEAVETDSVNPAAIKSASDITSLQENENNSGNSKNVNWVSLIVNALDKKHFHTELDRFQKLVVKNDFDIAEVIAIGPVDYSKTIEDRMVKFSARGGRLRYKLELPKKYKITTSPALVVATNEGLQILEGVSNYNRFFNSKAEFVQ